MKLVELTWKKVTSVNRELIEFLVAKLILDGYLKVSWSKIYFTRILQAKKLQIIFHLFSSEKFIGYIKLLGCWFSGRLPFHTIFNY